MFMLKWHNSFLPSLCLIGGLGAVVIVGTSSRSALEDLRGEAWDISRQAFIVIQRYFEINPKNNWESV